MLVSFVLMVLSSVIAAWSDISSTINSLTGAWNGTAPAALLSNELPKSLAGALNIGYCWMFSNCLASAAYVCPTLL
jgi:GDP-mannose transporter